MTERIVTGVKKLDRKLKHLHRKSANRVARAGLLKGARLAAKLIKKEIPSRLKTVRKAIGSSVKKSKGGITTAKAGASVGKKAKKPAKRSTKHGVGMDAANIHWWLLGTKERRTNTRSTGKMPSNPVVKKAMSGGIRQVLKAVLEGGFNKLNSELAKLKRK